MQTVESANGCLTESAIYGVERTRSLQGIEVCQHHELLMVQEIQNPLIPEHLLAHANLMRAINAHNGIIITQTYDKEQLRQRTDLHEVYNSGILPEALELIEITFENAEIIHTFLISNSAIIIAWFRYKTKRCIIIKNAIENTDITIQGSNDIDQAIRLCEKLKKTRDDS